MGKMKGKGTAGMCHGWTELREGRTDNEHKRFLKGEWELLPALPMSTIPNFKWQNLGEIKNAHLFKFHESLWKPSLAVDLLAGVLSLLYTFRWLKKRGNKENK